jgi:hypothetical protein
LLGLRPVQGSRRLRRVQGRGAAFKVQGWRCARYLGRGAALSVISCLLSVVGYLLFDICYLGRYAALSVIGYSLRWFAFPDN